MIDVFSLPKCVFKQLIALNDYFWFKPWDSSVMITFVVGKKKKKKPYIKTSGLSMGEKKAILRK